MHCVIWLTQCTISRSIMQNMAHIQLNWTVSQWVEPPDTIFRYWGLAHICLPHVCICHASAIITALQRRTRPVLGIREMYHRHHGTIKWTQTLQAAAQGGLPTLLSLPRAWPCQTMPWLPSWTALQLCLQTLSLPHLAAHTCLLAPKPTGSKATQVLTSLVP